MSSSQSPKVVQVASMESIDESTAILVAAGLNEDEQVALAQLVSDASYAIGYADGADKAFAALESQLTWYQKFCQDLTARLPAAPEVRDARS